MHAPRRAESRAASERPQSAMPPRLDGGRAGSRGACIDCAITRTCFGVEGGGFSSLFLSFSSSALSTAACSAASFCVAKEENEERPSSIRTLSATTPRLLNSRGFGRAWNGREGEWCAERYKERTKNPALHCFFILAAQPRIKTYNIHEAST